jgi:hypothetical protein
MVELARIGKRNLLRRTFFWALFAAIIVMGHVGPYRVEAAQTDLTWTVPTTNNDGTPVTNLSGYKVYWGNASGTYQQSVDVGNQTSYLLNSLTDGTTYYFAVAAYDSTGRESGYSKEISKTFPALAVTHTITATSGSGGTITAINNTNVSVATNGTSTVTTVTVNDGGSQTFNIAAATGNRINDVAVDGVSVGPVASYSFSNITANHTISASFALAQFSITASAGVGGTITPAGTAAVNYGSSATYAIAPASGYSISDVKVDGVSVGPVASYSFTNVTANHTISASFALAQFSITASAGVGGTITPAGTAAVSYGSSATYAIAPASGYSISDVKVDGVSVGPVASYTFNSVGANHTIQSSFSASAVSAVVFADNSGGSMYSDSKGVVYLADKDYSGGSVGSTTAAISGTSDPTLYQYERNGNFSYNIPVANGNYSVTLKFAETKWTSPGKRIFSVAIGGQTVISNLDLYAKVGKNTAYDVVTPVSVTNGAININFISKVYRAKINAILVTAIP